MKKRTELVTMYYFPPALILFLIFYASFQPASEQDIRPVLRRMTDRDYLYTQGGRIAEWLIQIREMLVLALREHTVPVIMIMLSLIVFGILFVRNTFQKNRTTKEKLVRLSLLGFLILVLLGTSVLVLASEEIASVISGAGLSSYAVSFLNWIDFHYAGRHVTLENYGMEGLLNFLFRKSAHFVLYALLAFFMFRAVYATAGRKGLGFVLAMVLVITAGSLDEFQQSFNPDRSGLVEDVILDTAGGFFGVCLALLLSPLMRKPDKETRKHR
ncbi:VanZ family protein [Salisediminibacterium selenitireducens]|uniref:VanZ-like domain-containing protein n=1 Tax=Bacillus selenitireducens (strain ATCC 700615 / DSM 15326 / MLS10) TaxID=439292 RepID=D6Y082_BACIE|nr:VanZ family protein [Salisediminibacterium selenitireducens]ADH98473.1 hypothetical protein Bsel_0951 [[Bacillus] selenitireducens MLS10]